MARLDSMKTARRHNAVISFGANRDIGIGTEFIWPLGGSYTWLDNAATLYISSSAEADISIPVVVVGYDASGNEQRVIATTNASDGRVFVALTGTWTQGIRLAYVDGADSPVGNIYISSSNVDADANGIPDTASTIKAYIAVGTNQTQQALYCVPAGFTYYLHSVRATGGKVLGQADRNTKVEFIQMQTGKVSRQVGEIQLEGAGGTTPPPFVFEYPLDFPAGTRLWVQATADTASTVVQAVFDGWLEKAEA